MFNYLRRIKLGFDKLPVDVFNLSILVRNKHLILNVIIPFLTALSRPAGLRGRDSGA